MASKGGVELPEGASGSSFLHELLLGAVDAFPDVFGDVAFPRSAGVFKATFGDVLVRFEAARAASPRRVEIARSIRTAAAGRLRFVDEAGARPFAEVLASTERADPLPVTTWKTGGPGVLTPSVRARPSAVRIPTPITYTGDALIAWLAEARRQRVLTGAVQDALTRLVTRATRDGGLSLRGQKFALLGAGAELAPTELLLAAGAEVLWIDLRPPPDLWRSATHLGGTLVVPTEPANLLASPDRIAATLRAFAGDDAIHVGMYAYAGGESQEFRLTASMNGIVRALPRASVRSVSLLISPTTPMVVDAEDAAESARRLASAPLWQRALARAGVLRQGQVRVGDAVVAASIVPIQGASYQAAQYVGKTLAAETYAHHGTVLGDDADPLTVSANVAPITATRSLAHPVFEAGFLGAPAWNIFISEAETTRELNGLLAIHDVTDPEAPGASTRTYASAAARAHAISREQVHGGVYALPYGLDGGIRTAAVIGIGKKPSLIRGLVTGG